MQPEKSWSDMYIDAKEMKKEVCISKKQGSVTARLGEMILLMVRGVWVIYSKTHPTSADEAESDTILKCIKVLPYIDCRRKPSWIFNYFTTTCFNNYRRLYSEHYKAKRRWANYVDTLDWKNLPQAETVKGEEHDGEG